MTKLGVKIEAKKLLNEAKKKSKVEKSKLKWQRRESSYKAAKRKILPEKIEIPKKAPEVIEKEVPEKIKKVEEIPKVEEQLPEKAPEVIEKEVPEKIKKVEEIPKKIKEIKKAPKVVEKKLKKALTDIKGIGPKRAKELEAIGIKTVDSLAKSSPKKIARSLNIATKDALRWIKEARK